MNITSPHAQPASARIHGTLHLRKRTAATNADTAAHVDLTHPTDNAKHANNANSASNTHAQAPALPHERDEKVGMTGDIVSPVVQQAARDLKRGIQDTSKSVETDVAYAKLKQS